MSISATLTTPQCDARLEKRFWTDVESNSLNSPQAGGSAFNQIVSPVNSPEIVGRTIALLFWLYLCVAGAFYIQLTAVTRWVWSFLTEFLKLPSVL